MLLIFHYLLVMIHRLQGQKKFKITSKVYGTTKNPGETNKILTPDDQNATAPEQIILTPGIPNDHSALSKKYMLSTSPPKSSTSVTPDKRHPRNNIVIMKSSTLRKNPKRGN